MSPSGQIKAKFSELNNNNIIFIIITKRYAASENYKLGIPLREEISSARAQFPVFI